MASSQMEQSTETETIGLALQTIVVHYALLLELIDQEADDLASRLQSKLAAGRPTDQPRLRVHVGERRQSADLLLARAMVQRVGNDVVARQRCRPPAASNCVSAPKTLWTETV